MGLPDFKGLLAEVEDHTLSTLHAYCREICHVRAHFDVPKSNIQTLLIPPKCYVSTVQIN